MAKLTSIGNQLVALLLDFTTSFKKLASWWPWWSLRTPCTLTIRVQILLRKRGWSWQTGIGSTIFATLSAFAPFCYLPRFFWIAQKLICTHCRYLQHRDSIPWYLDCDASGLTSRAGYLLTFWVNFICHRSCQFFPLCVPQADTAPILGSGQLLVISSYELIYVLSLYLNPRSRRWGWSAKGAMCCICRSWWRRWPPDRRTRHRWRVWKAPERQAISQPVWAELMRCPSYYCMSFHLNKYNHVVSSKGYAWR